MGSQEIGKKNTSRLPDSDDLCNDSDGWFGVGDGGGCLDGCSTVEEGEEGGEGRSGRERKKFERGGGAQGVGALEEERVGKRILRKEHFCLFHITKILSVGSI